MRTIAVINQKGGCGKTTTSINLAASLAELGQRTLLVDMDPQGHCGLGLAVPEGQIETTIAEAMLAERGVACDLNDVLWQISGKLDLAPASVGLAAVEMRLGQAADRDLRLAKVLDRLREKYAFCIVDCPPSIGLLTFNALRAAGEVIIPVDTGYFALSGSIRQVETLEAMTERCGHRVSVYVLANMVDPSQRLSRQIHEEMRNHFGDRVLPTAIGQHARVREAASFGQPISEYDAGGRAAADFEALAHHLLELDVPERDPADAAAAAEPHELARHLPLAGGGAALAVEAATAAQAAGHGYGQAHGHPGGGRTFDVGGGRGEGGGKGRSGGNSRMEDLMRRARALADRTAAMEETMAREPEVARLAAEQPAGAAAVAVEPAARASLAQKLERIYGARITSQGALFVQPADEAERVELVGDFNGWSPRATPMHLNRRLNVWEACIPLPPGKYRYRLVVDGAWRHDRHNQQVEKNAAGELDSVLEVR